jgi:hypothetical protein
MAFPARKFRCAGQWDIESSNPHKVLPLMLDDGNADLFRITHDFSAGNGQKSKTVICQVQ